jgi:hypothetical protein
MLVPIPPQGREAARRKWDGPRRLAQAEEIYAEMQKLRVLITCDGETFQLRSIDRVRDGADAARVKVMEFMKFPAACSFIFQRCDVQPGFRTLQRRAAYSAVDDPSTYVEPEYMQDALVVESLAVLDAASRRTYREFLVRFATFMCVSFPPGAVRSGWRDPGLIPYNPVFTLQRWPGFARLSDLAAKGFLTSQQILEKIVPHLPLSQYTIPSEVELESMTTNTDRWLTTWVNSDGTVAQIAANKERRHIARQEIQERTHVRDEQKQHRKEQAKLESVRREEVRLDREQRASNGGELSPLRKKRGKCAGVQGRTRSWR